MSSKAFTKKVFDWLHQVNRDKRVRKFDVSIALELTDYFNEDAKDGRAWPSLKTIADAINIREASVQESVRRLAALGHLHVIWGSQGRGRSNQYWMIVKPAPEADLFGTASTDRKPTPHEGLKPTRRAGFKNPRATSENLRAAQENHNKNQKRGERPGPPEAGGTPFSGGCNLRNLRTTTGQQRRAGGCSTKHRPGSCIRSFPCSISTVQRHS
jgi:hypothetical protein